MTTRLMRATKLPHAPLHAAGIMHEHYVGSVSSSPMLITAAGEGRTAVMWPLPCSERCQISTIFCKVS
jgi:hypothetical protein